MIHQVWTRRESNTFLACNSANLRPAFAYVELSDRMSLKRVSTAILNTSADAVIYSLALYRAIPAPFDRNRPLKDLPSFGLTLVANLGTFQTNTTAIQRFNATLPRELIIDGSSAHYFIGFAVSDITIAQWRTSDPTSNDSFPLYALDGQGVLTSIGAWPTNIQCTHSAIDLPSFVLRSAEGIFYLGSLNDDP